MKWSYSGWLNEAKPVRMSNAQAIAAVIARAERHTEPETATRLDATREEVELEFWRAIEDGNDSDDFELYVEKFPHGVYASLTKRKIAQLRGAPGNGTLPITDPAFAHAARDWFEKAAAQGHGSAKAALTEEGGAPPFGVGQAMTRGSRQWLDSGGPRLAR